MGEKDAQRIGDVCPGIRNSDRCLDDGHARDAPPNVEEHLVAGLTRNTLWGEQYTVMTSSSVNAPDEWPRTSSSIDFAMTIRDGVVDVPSSFGRATWNMNGTGSSS